MKKHLLSAAMLGTSLLASIVVLQSCDGDGTPETSTETDQQGLGDASETYKSQPPPSLNGRFVDTITFSNPYPHIPAQCYIETSRGTQNACQFCHTNGAYDSRLGNNLPQAGASPRIGNLQLDYSFAPFDSTTILSVVNNWENTLAPERLREAVAALDIDPARWDMETYIRQDNWQAAFDKRGGETQQPYSSNAENSFRVFPGLSPTDLPADSDGFVRSQEASRGFFFDNGWVTGWRAVNFVPYGIFSPMTGSVSGIYIRLPEKFMKNAAGDYDLEIYKQNLNLLELAIQDRLPSEQGVYYTGLAHDVAVHRGSYPVGTEFAHPLHYVDVDADGSNPDISPFPGTRAKRVKEIRYMYKWKAFDHDDFRPGDKEEGLPVYGNGEQGWVDNGVGWYLAGFIEDADGALRPQNLEELTQCIGCHSGVARTELGGSFTSGTGNTIDSTWALPRKLPGELGWQEMNYLGYIASEDAADDETPGIANMGDPINRNEGKGEYRHFLDNVVGVSLYGDMPESIESFLAQTIRMDRGYSNDWPSIDTSSAEAFNDSQAVRQRLIREMTVRKEHLTAEGLMQGALLYPPKQEALAAAARYRQVVVTQRYHKGKDVFPQTPVTYRYFRLPGEGYTHLDGQPYAEGEIITDRPVDTSNLARDTYQVGSEFTLIREDLDFEDGGTYNPDYLPLISYPLAFE